MSLSVDKLEVVPSLTSMLGVDKPVQYMAYIGGNTNTFKEVISTSYSNSQVSFTCNPPSPNIITSRLALLKVPVTLTFNGVPAVGSGLLQSGFDAFRAFPLQSVINNLTVTLNNTKMTLESNEVIHEMMRYYGEEKELETLSMTPCYPDQSQEYVELASTLRNCLAQFGEKNSGVGFRGSYPYTSFNNPVNGNVATVSATLCEPLVISPLLFGGHAGKGFLHLQNMSVTINFDSNLARMWSHASPTTDFPIVGASTISSITVQIGKPSLLLQYVIPPATMSLPRQVDYDYQDMEIYVNEAGASYTHADGIKTINSSNIQLNVIPSHIMIYIKERKGDRTFNTTDAYMSIENIDLSFGGVSGLLTGADKFALYNMSRENGVNMAWSDWSGEAQYVASGSSLQEKHGVGSLLVLKMAKDICLNDPSITVGTPGTYNLYAKVQFRNQNTQRAIHPALYIVPVYAGVLSMRDNQSIQSLAVLSQNDVLDASERADEDGAIDASEYEGGKFWGDVSKYAQKALPYIRKARKLGQQVASAIPTPQAQAVKSALDVAEAVGLGKRGRRGGVPVGGVLVGGQKLSRADMRRALQL